MTLMTDVKTRWDRVAQRLRAELGEDLYTSWFARMEPEDLDSGRLTVSVPTRFLKSWIETHYLSKLHEDRRGGTGSPRQRACARAHAGRRCSQARHRRSASLSTARRGRSPARRRSPRRRPPRRPLQLDPAQTFDTFVVGPSNQLAHAAMCRVADAAPGAAISFNPLFIHAGSGLGKTHLLSAVAHRIREKRPDRRVMMLTAERFMINFVVALRQRDTLAFKDQFQAIDVLLIDDFQFLQGKTMQQEFCNAFNGLVDSRRQVIVAADVPPAQLDSIDLRMRSRLMGGLVVDIELPDLDTRRRILRSRYETMLKRDASVIIPDEVLEFVASRITGSGRELEGALNRIAAYQQFNQAAVTLDLASLVLRDMQANPDGSRIKIDDILKVVGRHFNVGRTDLLSPRRARSVVVPRQIGMYLAKKMTARSLPEIGRRFGGRDHSTVLHAVRKIEDQIKTDDRLAREVALLIRLVEQG